MQSKNRRYFILASAHFVEENELEHFESPWENIREPWPNERMIYDRLLVDAVTAGRRAQILLGGADPNVALEIAVDRDELESLRMLLEFGAEPVSGGHSG